MTHLPFRRMPKAHVIEGGKIILMHRDPKDTAVSNYHFAKNDKFAAFKSDFTEFLQFFTSDENGFWYGVHIQYLLE